MKRLTATDAVIDDGCRVDNADPSDDLLAPGGLRTPAAGRGHSQSAFLRHLFPGDLHSRTCRHQTAFCSSAVPKAVSQTGFDCALWQLCRLVADGRVPQSLISCTIPTPFLPRNPAAFRDRKPATTELPPLDGALRSPSHRSGPGGGRWTWHLSWRPAHRSRPQKIPVLINGMSFTAAPRADRIEPS